MTLNTIILLFILFISICIFIQFKFNSIRIKNIERKTNGMVVKMEAAAEAFGNLTGRKELKAEQEEASHLSQKT